MIAYLHIGVEKTGTTTIQDFLKRNTEALNSLGYTLPAISRSPCHRYLAGYSMDVNNIDQFIEEHNLSNPEKKQQWKKEIERKLNENIKNMKEDGHHTVIFSCEHLHSKLFNIKEVETLNKLLAPHFEEIRIIGYLRRQDQLATSLYSTFLKDGGASKQILLESLRNNTRYFDYMSMYERWTNVFGENSVNFRIYENKNDIRNDFLNFVNITNTDEFNFGENLNTGLSGNEQYFKYLYNSTFISDGGKYSDLEAILESTITPRKNVPAASLSQQEAKDFYEKYADSNRKLARLHFNKDELFDLNFSNLPIESAIPSSMDEQTLLEILQGFKAHIDRNAIKEIKPLPKRSKRLLNRLKVSNIRQRLKRFIESNHSPPPPGIVEWVV